MTYTRDPVDTVPNGFFAFGTVSEPDALTQDALVIMAIITEDFNTTGSLDSSVAAWLYASIEGLEFDFGGKYLFY